MVEKAYKPIIPFKEVIIKEEIPFPTATPIGVSFEYFNHFTELLATGVTAGNSSTFVVPNDRNLFVTNCSVSLYLDTWTAGLQSHGWARVKTDGEISYLAFMMIRGGRVGALMNDSSDNQIINFPVPIRIKSGETITFHTEKSSFDVNSIIRCFIILHGYFLKKV